MGTEPRDFKSHLAGRVTGKWSEACNSASRSSGTSVTWGSLNVARCASPGFGCQIGRNHDEVQKRLEIAFLRGKGKAGEVGQIASLDCSAMSAWGSVSFVAGSVPVPSTISIPEWPKSFSNSSMPGPSLKSPITRRLSPAVQVGHRPLPQPQALGELLAAVFDGEADLGFAPDDGAVGVLRLGMDADQPQRVPPLVVSASSSGGLEKRMVSSTLSASRS